MCISIVVLVIGYRDVRVIIVHVLASYDVFITVYRLVCLSKAPLQNFT